MNITIPTTKESVIGILPVQGIQEARQVLWGYRRQPGGPPFFTERCRLLIKYVMRE